MVFGITEYVATAAVFVCGFFIYIFATRMVSRRGYDLVSEQNKDLEHRLRASQVENASLQKRVDELSEELRAARERMLSLEVENKSLTKMNMQLDEFSKLIDGQCKVHFENLANKIFDEKIDKFNRTSKEGLGQVLEPMKENMELLKRKLEESFLRYGQEQFSLKNEIKRIVLANERITLQAEGLTNALKGDNKMQGNWGEVVLQRVLEDSGLRRDCDYKVQSSGMNLTGVDGGRQYPDVVVLLPDNKHIVVDSKVSLVHYERYCSECGGEAAKLSHLKSFVNSVRGHVNDLSGKRYSDIVGINAPDFVLMFIPIESAYFLMVRADPELHGHAWAKKIVIVCPSTLLATLKTIESLWRLERQNRNTMEIARQGGALYDKVAGFVNEMQKLGKQINSVGTVYEEAMKKLSEGHGNILARTRTLKSLGVKTSKNMEVGIIDSDCEAGQ